MGTHKITTTISTNNNLDYLKLAIKSIRQNAYYKDMPIIVHAENCNDGTFNWLDSCVARIQPIKFEILSYFTLVRPSGEVSLKEKTTKYSFTLF